MKVAVYAISKNEEKHIDRWLSSVAAAGTIVVGDSSTDNTASILRGAGVRVHPLNIKPFRFDDARNAVLALVPADVDVCIALDLDEVLIPGWRKALEKAWVSGTNQLNVTYRWNETTTFMHNCRVHSRHGWRWRHPGHEALYPWMTKPVTAECPDFMIEHHPDLAKPRPNILELMAWGQWEEPNSLRMLYYYGRELMFQGFYQDAIGRFERYLALEPLQPFPAERAQTLLCLQDCHIRVRQPA